MMTVSSGNYSSKLISCVLCIALFRSCYHRYWK